MNMSDKISVYGSTGFIGGTFCRLFPDQIIQIPRNDREPQSNNILYLISTTTNHNVFDNLQIDVDTNLKILLEALEKCKNENIVFNYVSTGFVYGLNINDALETDPCDPRGFYSITKRAAEQLIISFCQTFNVKYRIIRLANLYGDDKTVSPKKNVLGFLINLMKEDKTITLHDGGSHIRDYTHVDDVCRGIKLVMDRGEMNSIYNVASGESMPFRNIMEKARELLNSKSEFVSVETPDFNKAVLPSNFYINTNKLKTLGFVPSISLEQGLKNLCS